MILGHSHHVLVVSCGPKRLQNRFFSFLSSFLFSFFFFTLLPLEQGMPVNFLCQVLWALDIALGVSLGLCMAEISTWASRLGKADGLH